MQNFNDPVRLKNTPAMKIEKEVEHDLIKMSYHLFGGGGRAFHWIS